MTQFSKSSIQKLTIHLEKLKNSSILYRQNFKKAKDKTYQHSKIFIKNRNLAKALLLETLFLNLEIRNLQQKKCSIIQKLLLKNKKSFISKNAYTKSYLTKRSIVLAGFNVTQITTQSKELIQNLILTAKRKFWLLVLTTKDVGIKIEKSLDNYYYVLRYKIIGKWYIFFGRFFILTLIHFIPFIQLTTSLFYCLPNRQVVHPINASLFNIAPFLVPLMNITMPILNNDNFSFLILVPYLYFFIYSFKKYKISRKIAYQGSFAVALMLFRYSLMLILEALTVIFKFSKRFFILKNSKKIDLLRDDLSFYVEDLEELRSEREYWLQLGESIFSVDDISKIAKLWESTTIFALLGVIALLYNYMYFILRGQKPIIPIVTKTVRRMMIDRNGEES